MSFKQVSGRAPGVRGVKHYFTVSLIALGVANAVGLAAARAADSTTAPASSQAQQSNDSNGDTVIVSAGGGDNTDSVSQPEHDYTVPATRAGTKLNLTPRDIPQSVSIVTKQRIKDQDLQNISDVLHNAAGISASQNDTERFDFYSRGFYINNYTYDDIPTTQNASWNFGDTDDDAAIYDRIEIVRGSTGLMTGTGNPGASINMVRKKADSKTFSGNLSASYGSWNDQRYVADVSGPLNQSGTVRGRIVAGYQDKDSWLDRYHQSKKFLYGNIEADLTDSTTVDVGYSYQARDTGNPTWGGLPAWYSNGEPTRYDRSSNPAADWAHYNILSRKVFANLTTNFDNGWQVRLNSAHSETDFDSKLFYVSGFADKTTGLLTNDTSAYGGWYDGLRTQDAIDAYASGPFELLGRQHELVVGLDYSRQRNRYYGRFVTISANDVGSTNGWNGNVTEPDWGEWALNGDDTIRQKAGYTAARFSLTDPLSLIVGARYTQYSTNGITANMDKNNLTPYGGLVYDINDTYSAFVSYTSIFQPQTYRDRQGAYLKPVIGKDYEAGVKSDWFNGRLTASLSVFRIEQENLGQLDGSRLVPGSSEYAYYASKGVVSRGAEFELNGAVTDNLMMTFSASRYVAKDINNDRVNANLPQTQLKLFTSYNLPMLPQLTIGGGVNWQNRTFKDLTGPSGNTVRLYQGSYPLADLFARYQVDKNLSVQANVKNVFDREYNTGLTGGVIYGEPRNYSVSVNYTF
ncbi:ferric-rhodotorulic acid/ferric-coprogen receptor FhuE [Brenneria goodwinii]|uniref:ferric-rhodotorulic acid/ferric-coprogen receptor FhuE n=1 Tax=Brenneria goodwinii TaxID=1109412 RepID=UPI0036F09815